MALFEFDRGRLFPAQFGHAIEGEIPYDVVAAVCSQLLELISRPLFPITWVDMPREPRLIALDASGQVVSVQVVEKLTSQVLIESLSRLADTAALSWSDLAQFYPEDLGSFKSEWLRFRDAMPSTAGSGPRLIMVVSFIDPTVRPALDVLAASGVEVHEISVRQMSNGRMFVDVEAVGPRMYSHSPQVVVGRTAPNVEIEAAAPTTSNPAPAITVNRDPQIDRLRTEGIPVLDRDREGLLALARIAGDTVPLVADPESLWPEDMSLNAEAPLLVNGLAYDTPQDAMALLSISGDGWTQLHFVEMNGPTLAEAMDEVNRDMVREYRRTESASKSELLYGQRRRSRH